MYVYPQIAQLETNFLGAISLGRLVRFGLKRLH